MKKQGMIFTSVSAMLFGLIPLITSILYGYGLNAVSVSFYRYAIMLPILFLLCCKQKLSFRITKRQAFHLLWATSLFSTATMLLLNSSYLYLSTGVATTLHFLYPFFVIILCKLFYRDRLEPQVIKSLSWILLGILCFFVNMKIDSFLGVCLALFSALTYAIYLVEMEKKRLTVMHPFLFSFYISLDTCLLLGAVNLATSSIHLPTSYDMIGWLCLISLMSFLGLFFLQQGSKQIGAKLSSLFSLFEPVTSLFAGFLILQEELSVWKVIGCLFIFIAVMKLAIPSSKNDGL